MPSPIEFEPATAADAEALADLRVEAMRESLERVGRFDPGRARRRFLDGFAAAHTFHILLGGQRVGFYVLKDEAAGGLLLDHLYIRPGRQGQGIGAAVLAEVFSLADRQGRAVRVGALKESASNRFYARHRFELVEQAEFDNHYVRAAGGCAPTRSDSHGEN